MAQGFDTGVPGTGSGLTSAPVRTNFDALVTNHLGTSAPSGGGLPIKGMTFWDTSNVTNEQFKVYNGTIFLVLFEHLETAATLQFNGFANVRKYIHTQSISATTWTVTHNLGTKNVLIQLYDSSDVAIPETAITSITTTSTSVVTVVFGAGQTGRGVVIAAI